MDGDQVDSKLVTDRKGLSYYDFKTYCVSCYDEAFGARERAYYEAIKTAVESSIKKTDGRKNSTNT